MSEPELFLALPSNITREQELRAAAIIAQHPLERVKWWAMLTEWATDVQRQGAENWASGLVRGVYAEAVSDAFRRADDKWLPGVSYEGTNQEIFSQIYCCLIETDKWNLEQVPDVPVAFLRNLYAGE